jgi:hypothetical protein
MRRQNTRHRVLDDRSGMATRGERGKRVTGLTKGKYMGIKQVVWGSIIATSFIAPVAVFADTISGTAGAAFQSWAVTNLNQNSKPYWDNTSLDGSNENIGFFLVNAPTAPLAGAPGALPFWGNTFNSAADTGGSADPSFFFQKNSSFSIASLELEVAANTNINDFGWYDTTNPTVLHTIFAGGSNSPPASGSFTPSANYGFWLKGDGGTYYTQSSLNPGGDTSHQHFTVFEQSSTNGAEVYWLGIEDFNLSEFHGAEGGVGDYQDMLVRISGVAVPEPSTVALVVSSTLLMLGLRRRRR